MTPKAQGSERKIPAVDRHLGSHTSIAGEKFKYNSNINK